MADTLPILLDTDIGSDIDDAITLAYLLAQPRCELLGVTTVTGEPQVRAQLADAVCRAFGRGEVPIHSGAGTPLLVPQMQPEAPQKSVLPRYTHREHFAANTAIDFLRETIRSRPGEITLLSVGALTNVGLLFAVDPEIPRLLKRYVMMGGVYVSRPPGYGIKEWNIMTDPHAAAIVFGANAPGTRCFGLDVTTQCRMPIDECRRRFNRGRLEILGEMAEVWFRSRPYITFHDPLAAAAVFEPDLCKYQAGLVEIELHSPRLIGYTDFRTETAAKPHEVAVSVDPDAFFEHYFGILDRLV
jgi:purine nucleosidase